jgi:hypothetical protein
MKLKNGSLKHLVGAEKDVEAQEDRTLRTGSGEGKEKQPSHNRGRAPVNRIILREGLVSRREPVLP